MRAKASSCVQHGGGNLLAGGVTVAGGGGFSSGMVDSATAMGVSTLDDIVLMGVVWFWQIEWLLKEDK